MALLGPRVFDRLRFVDHHPLPVLAVEEFAVPLQQAVAGEHKINVLQGFFQGRRCGRPPGPVVLGDRQFGGERLRFTLPVRQHGGRSDKQHRTFQLLFCFEVLQEGQQLDGFAQAHVVGEAGALIKAVEEGQPTEASFLVGPELTAESFWCWERIGRLLLVVLLQHGLQSRAGIEAMHREPHQQLAFSRGDAQGFVQAQFWIGAAKAFGIA